MSEIEKILELIHEDGKETRDSVRNIYNIINGNGSPGLKTEIAANTKYREDQERKGSRVWGWITATVTSLAAAAIALFGK